MCYESAMRRLHLWGRLTQTFSYGVNRKDGFLFPMIAERCPGTFRLTFRRDTIRQASSSYAQA
jgi:hypothetical protein